MIVGHEKIIHFFDKAVKKGNLAHAYIFTGPEHVGKFMVAMDLAEKILGDIKETNPDLIIIRPETTEKNGIVKKKDISVEAIRELRRKIMLAPSGRKFKMAIISDAEYLNISAQNALLKTLEEPPASAVLVLVVQNISKLLPTIVSRCQIKKFNIVSEKDIEKIIPEENKYRKEIIFWSLGRPGLAKNYLENNTELKNRQEEFTEFKKLLTMSLSDKFMVAESISKDTTKLIDKMNWWLFILRESMVKNDNIIKITQEKALVLIEKISASIRILKETNSNARLVTENLMLEINIRY